MSWQPIETAPKDGAEIILWRQYTSGPIQGRWINASHHRPAGWYWAGYEGAVGPIEPTHWHPLPVPPAVKVDER